MLSCPTWSARVAGTPWVARVPVLASLAVAAGVSWGTDAGHGAVRVEVALAAEPGMGMNGFEY